MENKVAVVTGSNKGIGYAIVKELCRRGVGTVYLTARDKNRGEKAVQDLKNEGFNPTFYELDVTYRESVKGLAEHLKKKHSGLDILFNNAAVINEDYYKTTYEDSKKILDTNYYSLLIIQEYIYPILNDNARVINVSSDAGHISNLRNEYWIKRLSNPDIKIDDVNAFVSWFLDSVRDGSLKEEDFVETPLLAYRVSKVALCALTRVQQSKVGREISVNSLHPGFVKTDMTKGAGYLTMEEASKAPVYLALDADQSLKGKYIWFDKTEKNWADPELKIHSRMDLFAKGLEEVGYAS